MADFYTPVNVIHDFATDQTINYEWPCAATISWKKETA